VVLRHAMVRSLWMNALTLGAMMDMQHEIPSKDPPKYFFFGCPEAITMLGSSSGNLVVLWMAGGWLVCSIGV